MVFISLIHDEMRNLKLLSTGKHKVRVSTQTKIYVSQDTTSTSLSHSLREVDYKQRSPGTTNTSKTVPENLVLKPGLGEHQSLYPNEQSNFEKDQLAKSSDVETELTRASSDAERNSRPSTSSSAQSAAAFFGNISLRNDSSILEACESIDRLNQYLRQRKADVEAGVPGQFLHAVIGQAVADVGSVVSTIACAFFLNETQTSSQHCVLPVINTKRADFMAHSELKWLLNSCRVDESSIVFVDEIDLSYHNRFGNLKLVLVNDHKLPPNKEGLKDVPIEMFNCKEVCSESASLEDVTMSQDGSCCTLISDKYAETSPEILAGQGFSRLLLSGILLDTKNLTGANCTAKDKYMATLLIKGAGRFGCSGLYQLLKYKISDISELQVRDILRRDFKKWSTYSGKHNIPNTGMSSIGISIEELLKHEDSAAKEVIQFQESEKLRLFVIVSGHYDSQKNFKRELLVCTDTPEFMKNFLRFLSTNGTDFPLKSMNLVDLRHELRAFEINNMLTSRRSIEQLLDEFDGALKKRIAFLS
ncbi:uncharacterized protein LOC103983695 [Musa acuminata AAA Group]|uniref:uncharacterized protein LOC103983695 n=1 Tax=Musa acuminata AAA Group TaxID=214697 RepID=UPI0031D6AB24